MAVQLLIHMICLFKAVVGIQGGCSLFTSSQVLWHGLLPAVPDPKAANEAVCELVHEVNIVNRENIFSKILGNAIELVIAPMEVTLGGYCLLLLCISEVKMPFLYHCVPLGKTY